MSKKTRKKRLSPLSIRVTEEEKERIVENANKAGQSVSGYLKKLALNVDPPRQSRRPPVEQKMLAQMLAHAAAIRDQLHEISLTGADDRQALLMERAVDDLAEIRAALLNAMGRKP
jgi:hypothetical protein